MKKIYLTTLLLLFAFAGVSQNIDLLDIDNNSIKNDTLFLEAESDDSLEIHLSIVNLYTRELPVLVKKYELKVQEGSENTFCWGTCYPPNVYVASTALTIAPQDTNKNDFYLDFYPLETEGSNRIGLTFYNENNEEDSAFVVVDITITGSTTTGFGQPEMVEQVYPNPAKDVLYVQLNGITEKEVDAIRIYDAMGRLQKVDLLRGGKQIKLSTASLLPGMYLVAIHSGNRRSVKKIMIR